MVLYQQLWWSRVLLLLLIQNHVLAHGNFDKDNEMHPSS